MSVESFGPPTESDNSSNDTIPENNELPLNLREGKKHAVGAESTVYRVVAENNEAEKKLLALKQIHKEKFASEEEMKKSKEFYEFLKEFPEFGKFVPKTMYFKARMTAEDAPQGYMIQHFSEGKSIDSIDNEELYKDPAVVRQLLEFANASISILEKTREEKIHRPDFGTAFSADRYAVMVGNYLSNPRYSTNIIVSDAPNENGQRVFFVDTGINVDERTNKNTEAIRREVGGRLQVLQLKRWAKNLKKILREKGEDMGTA